MSAFFWRVLHEIAPFFKYWRLHSRITRQLDEYISGHQLPEGAVLDAIRAYCGAKPSDLKEALVTEHARAIALDEKTFRHAASIATALTVASAATTAVAQLLSSPFWKLTVVAFTVLSIVYVIAGGVLGFAAIRPHRTFGIGMRFKLEEDNEQLAMKPYVLAEALACQESINLIHSARNEAAFMSVRNGFICVVVAIAAVLIGVQFTIKTDAIEPKIWPASLHRS